MGGNLPSGALSPTTMLMGLDHVVNSNTPTSQMCK